MAPAVLLEDRQRHELVTSARALAFEWNELGRWDDAAALLSAVHIHLRYFYDGGDPEAERGLFDRAIEPRREIGDAWGTAMSVFYRGCVDHVVYADAAKSRPFFEEAYRIADEADAPVVKSYAARHLGQIEQEEGRLDEALRYLEESLELRAWAGWRVGTIPAAIALAEIHRVRGDREPAIELLRYARDVAIDIQAPFSFELACTEYDELARGSREGGANVRVVLGPKQVGPTQKAAR